MKNALLVAALLALALLANGCVARVHRVRANVHMTQVSVAPAEPEPTPSTASRPPASEPVVALVTASQRCVDVDRGQARDGARVISWSCHGGFNQQWRMYADGTIRGHDGRCLDIAHEPAGRVHMWTCHGGENQRWRWLPDGTLRGSEARCLEVGGEGDGAHLIARPCEGKRTQRFGVRSY